MNFQTSCPEIEHMLFQCNFLNEAFIKQTVSWHVFPDLPDTTVNCPEKLQIVTSTINR